MKKKSLIIVPAIALFALLGASTVVAHGGFGGMWKSDPAAVANHWESMIAEQASILGLSADEMKSKWAEGKTLKEIAAEKGISEADLQAKMKAAREAEMKEQLQNLVSQGKLTQAQADARLKFMQSRELNGKGKMMGGRHGGGMRMMGL